MKWPILCVAVALAVLGGVALWTLSRQGEEAILLASTDSARDPLETCVVARIRSEHGNERAAVVEAWLANPSSHGPGGDEGARTAQLIVAATLECAPTAGTGRRVPQTREQRQAVAEYMERSAEWR